MSTLSKILKQPIPDLKDVCDLLEHEINEAEKKENEYNSDSTDDTVRANDSDDDILLSDNYPKSPSNDESESESENEIQSKKNENIESSKTISRPPYKCNLCQQVKKGHICTALSVNSGTISPFVSSTDSLNVLTESTSSVKSSQQSPLSEDETDFASPPPQLQINNQKQDEFVTTIPLSVSLGWFDLTITSLTNLNNSLLKIPPNEWEPLQQLTNHLENAKEYFTVMKEEFGIESTLEPTSLLGKRSVSIIRDYNEGFLSADPADLVEEPALKQHKIHNNNNNE